MKKIRIGIICPSEIAFRRFMPAVKQCDIIEYVGVAHANAEEWFGKGNVINKNILEVDLEKAKAFEKEYGGTVYNGYEKLITSDEIDAVYLPLPPALHFKWAKMALESNKHIFLEKPSTTSAQMTKDLIGIAEKKKLAVHENYMFIFHKQINEISDIVNSGKIGDIRLYRIAFGFPKRASNDFRYNKKLGGGALLDCGGYTLKLASLLLGESAHIVCSQLNKTNDFDVDIYGSATMVNNNGSTAQISFGMDNSYKCDLEIWGSKGCITTERIFTAPAGFEPTVHIKVGNDVRGIALTPDDTFKKSIEYFCKCVFDDITRKDNYKSIIKQAELVDALKGDK